MAILAEREADARKDEAQARSLFEEGLATSADPARALAVAAEVRAEAAGSRAAAETSRAILAILIGAEAAARPLAPFPPPAAAPQAPAVPRDDIAAAELAAEAARQSASAADASRWPTFMVTGRYELHAPTAGGRYGDSATVFGGFRIPIFASGAVSARVAEARAGRGPRRRLSRAARTKQSEARPRGPGPRPRRRDSPPSRGQAARRAREIQQARYEEGAARLSDLLEARAAELRARMGGVGAAADRVLAEANLRMALGLPPEGEGAR
jgi:outer membrane protein TolC